MLFLLAAFAAAGASPSVVHIPQPAAAPSSCRPRGITDAKGVAPQHSLRRLGEEPPAAEYLAVVRNVGGCPEPAVVRTGIGR
jgi:hypothetical protein